jgi:hypothetical protein
MGVNSQQLEAKKSIPSSIECSNFPFPTHLLSEANSHELSSLCSGICQSIELDQSMGLAESSHISDFFCGTDNFISFHRLDQDGWSSGSGGALCCPGSLMEQQNGRNKTSDRSANCRHQCASDGMVPRLPCLHCILRNLRHDHLVLLYYGLQIMILFELLPRRACLHPPIPRHIGCLKRCADTNNKLGHENNRSSKKGPGGAGGASPELLSPSYTHKKSECESKNRFQCCGTVAKLELLSHSGDGNSEVSSLTSDGSIPAWSFEQVGNSLDARGQVEENTACADFSSIPSWSFIRLGESMYSSDITLEVEEAKKDEAKAADDSTIPAWSFVRLGDVLEA